MMDRKIKRRVRAGELSPMKALDLIHLARLAGHPAPPLEAWIERTIARIRKRGENPYLRRGDRERRR